MAFLGIDSEHPDLALIMPRKKPKLGELSSLELEHNREKARERIIAEDAIGGVKRLRAATDVFRNKRGNLDDQFMLIACGLWNFHIKRLEKEKLVPQFYFATALKYYRGRKDESQEEV